MKQLRVVIADDHPLFRTGLGHALRALGLDVVGEAVNGMQAVELCRRRSPDAVILDAKMPVMDGIVACRAITRADPAVRAVLLTTFTEPALVAAARDAGAVGFVSKETEATELGRMLRRLVDNRALGLFPPIELPRLTDREREVLSLLLEGFTNKEIARRLQLSPETVKDHVFNLYRKLDVEDRIGAARRASALGLC